jgi:hypothetical protein
MVVSSVGFGGSALGILANQTAITLYSLLVGVAGLALIFIVGNLGWRRSGDLAPEFSTFKALVSAAARISDTSQVDELADVRPNRAIALAFVQQNSDALSAARRALARHCSMSLRYDPDSWTDYWNDILPLRQLARAFRVEARLAEVDGNLEGVVRIGLDLLALANATRRGGLITGQLVSVAIAGNGLEVLRRIRGQLTEPLRQTLIANLKRLDAEREPFAEIAVRDDSWEAIVQPTESDLSTEPLHDPEESGISHEAQLALREAMEAIGEMPKSSQRAMHWSADHGDLARRRLLIVDLALRSHYAATGSYPAKLDDLSPRVLSPVPDDPYTDRPFLYRPSLEGFVLYSTGPKQTDAGGKFGCWPEVMQHRADLCLDEADYQEAWEARS